MIVRRLTLRDRHPLKRTPWRQKGFAKISDARLVEYWLKRINANPDDMAMACDIVENFVRNPQQDGSQSQPVVKKFDTLKKSETITVSSPPIKRMAKTLAESMTQWVKNGFKLTPDDKLQERLEICKGCDLWDKSALGGTGRCRECGCSTQAKLRLAHEKCPINKWGPIDQTPLTQTS